MTKGSTPPTQGVGRGSAARRRSAAATSDPEPCSAPTATGRTGRRPAGRDHRRGCGVPGIDALLLGRALRNRGERAAYCVASDCNRAAPGAVASKFGTVETMLRRTPYAAVATAASFRHVAAKRRAAGTAGSAWARSR